MRRAVAVVALLLVLAGCSSDSTKGSITGKLHFEGGVAAPSNGGVINGNVTAVRKSDGKTFTVVVPGSGVFTLSVPSGEYTVTGTSPLYQSGLLPCPITMNGSGATVVVNAGQTVEVDLPCQIM